jgi:hypothetical protein
MQAFLARLARIVHKNAVLLREFREWDANSHDLKLISRQKRVANLWTEFTAFNWYAMGADVKECKNLSKFLVAATFERSKTYVFDGFLIMNPTL